MGNFVLLYVLDIALSRVREWSEDLKAWCKHHQIPDFKKPGAEWALGLHPKFQVVPSRRGDGGGHAREMELYETYLPHRTLECGEETSGGKGEE